MPLRYKLATRPLVAVEAELHETVRFSTQESGLFLRYIKLDKSIKLCYNKIWST